MPTFWKSSPVEEIARLIVAGIPFKAEVLTAALGTQKDPTGGSLSRLKRAQAVFRMRLRELASDRGDVSTADAQFAELKTSLQSSLSSMPSDAFMWLALYWVKNSQEGFSEEDLRLLDRSYDLGPREGYIAVQRNRLALASFSKLTKATQDRVVDEFVGMVDSNITAEAAYNLAGPGWSIRERLLAALAGLDLAPKLALAKILRREGIRVQIPGLPELDERPW